MNKKQLSARIRELYTSGMTKQEIQDELKVNRRAVNNSTWYMIKKEKESLEPKPEIPEVKTIYPETIYSERDEMLHKFYASLNIKGALSMTHLILTESTYKGKSA